jgi:hypothetical protein
MAIAWQTKIPLDNQEGGGTQPLWTKPTILFLLQIKKTEKQSTLNKEFRIRWVDLRKACVLVFL